jgi:hypothetical protein
MERIGAWAEVRTAPVTATVGLLVAAMAYSMHWGKPPDLWGIARSSSALAHGDFAGIYFPHAPLTSPPGLEAVLAPVLALGAALGLHPLPAHAPSATHLWLLVGPAAILLGSMALFALDAVARHWRLSPARHMALALVGALGIGDVVVFWGHPEDCAAVALVVWAALALDTDTPSLRRAGWLFGLAIALQPLALLALAPVFARCTRPEVRPLAGRLILPSLIVLLPPLAVAAPHTLFVLIHQPSYPQAVSSTPFTRWAPSLGHGQAAGGPTRLASILLAAVAGFVVCRRRHQLPTVLAMAAVAFALRVLFETELAGYYFWPVAALCLLLALRHGWARFGVCTVAGVTCMVLGNCRVHIITLWWPAIMATTAVLLVTAVRRPTPAVECEPMILSVSRR